MFTAKIKSIAKFKGRITIIVEYSNGLETFEEEISSTSNADLKWLRSQVRNRVRSLSEVYAFADTLSVNQVIDTTADPEPTQAEIDRDIFIKNYTRWLAVKRAIDSEILTGSEAKVIELKNKVITDFRPAYLDII